MSEVNYRHEHGCSNKALKYAPKHIRRVGQIRTIEGYRWASRRSYVCEGDGERHYWRNTHERLRIRGENGQVLLDGVCWGYHGQGPRALVDMLVVAGLTKQLAEYVAFNSPRNDSAGVDWKITLGPDNKVVDIHFDHNRPKKTSERQRRLAFAA